MDDKKVIIENKSILYICISIIISIPDIRFIFYKNIIIFDSKTGDYWRKYIEAN